ncbi:MAG: leucine-rich repeat domain-containing protein [Clostridia bacterium]|nr:leucine-rich repeat domain-containing protein [Clostridia bacterium]
MRKKLNLKILCILFVLVIVSLVFSACNGTCPEIKFMNGDVDYATVRSSGNEIIDMPTDPQKDNLKFCGWFYDNNEWSEPFTAYSFWNTSLLANIKVYAKWEAIPATPLLNQVETQDGILLELSDDKTYYTVTHYNDKYGKISIPESYENTPITAIGSYAFRSCDNLTSITIPSTITSIGKYAFKYCHSLLEIEIPNSITTIAEYAFHGCGFTSITIPDSVTSIENNAFSYSSLTSIVIPNGVTTIADEAFENCSSLANIEIPDSVISIGSFAFEGTAWYNNQPDGLVYAGKVAYRYMGDMPENNSIEIKDGTKTIAGSTFENTGYNLVRITIPDSVTNIGKSAFYNCYNLSSVVISDDSNLTTIGDNAFYYCQRLSSINLPQGLTTIGNSAFYKNDFTSINIPSSVTNIGEFAFGNCKLNSITLGEGNLSYKMLDGVLFNNALTELIQYPNRSTATSYTIPDSVMSICPSAFVDCINLRSIFIPNSVTKIPNLAFSRCSSLISITIPESLTEIGYCAFWHCSALTSVTIPDSVAIIGESAFSNCTKLAEVIIPKGLTKLNNYIFSGCDSLISIKIPKNIISMNSTTFSGCDLLAEILVDAENQNYTSQDGILYSKDKTQIIDVPQGKVGEVVLPTGISSIPEYAFNNCEKITSITIPDSVTTIEAVAFRGCASLSEIIVDANSKYYTMIHGVLYNKNKTELIVASQTISGELVLPNEVKTISAYAFENCNTLSSIILPSSLTSIGEMAFYNCNNLVSTTIPRYLSIGYSAFSFCGKLQNVYYYGLNETRWNQLFADNPYNDLKNKTPCYYSETKIADGAHWHFVDDVPTIWT